MENERNSIVLDKSFLQGCKDQGLFEKIVQKNRILVTAELFYEISSSKELKTCFNRLLPLRNSIDLIEHLGTLYKFEIQEQRPCIPLTQHFIKGAELNKRFNFIFNQGQQKRIDDFEQYHEKEEPKIFEKVIFEIKSVENTYTVEDLKQKGKILEIYTKLTSHPSPPAEKLNENWALFRKLQIELMAAKEYLDSYKNGVFNITEKRKSHNQIDFRICIFGLLSKSIATNDNLIKRYFKLFCPDGIIYSLN